MTQSCSIWPWDEIKDLPLLLICIDLVSQISTVVLCKNPQIFSKDHAGTKAWKDTPAAHFYCIILFPMNANLLTYYWLLFCLTSFLPASPVTVFHSFVHFQTTQGRWQESQSLFSPPWLILASYVFFSFYCFLCLNL